MSDVNRNLPQERAEMVPIGDDTLQEWEEGGGLARQAAREIQFCRFWMEKMEKDITNGQVLAGRALRMQSKMLILITHIRTSLEDSGWSEEPEFRDLVDHIEKTMNAKLPHEGIDA